MHPITIPNPFSFTVRFAEDLSAVEQTQRVASGRVLSAAGQPGASG